MRIASFPESWELSWLPVRFKKGEGKRWLGQPTQQQRKNKNLL